MLKLKRLGIDTYREMIIFLREDCSVCQSEGFSVTTRVSVLLSGKELVATLYTVSGDLLEPGEASLSEYAWKTIGASEGDRVVLKHAHMVTSLSDVRSKVFGKALSFEQLATILNDITKGRYTPTQTAMFLTACVSSGLSQDEISALTKAMVSAGERLTWPAKMVMDKHCVGGLPGNRTTPIVTSIIAANGLMMPKTSSRAITSPAGTADTMEVVTRVDLTMDEMRAVVEKEGACFTWGGSVALSPADDALIRVERAISLDGVGQMVASILSKKIAAGSTHILIDVPVGPTAKIRSQEDADKVQEMLSETGKALGVYVEVIQTDGHAPIGNGVGPALEARDVIQVLKGDGPVDLLERSVLLAGKMLEMAGLAQDGPALARETIASGKAWEKFHAICMAQGGFKDPSKAKLQCAVNASSSGTVESFDCRSLANLAKLAGAPNIKEAGLDIHVKLGDIVQTGQPLYTIHANSQGELEYALAYAGEKNLIEIK